MTTKRSGPADVSLSAREKALLTKVERSKLEIAETEAELANFLSQRKQLNAEIAQAVGVERLKLQFARDVVADEIEGSKILLSEARVALLEATGQLDALHNQRELLPVLAARVAAYQRAQAELLISLDELLAGLADAAAQGVRVAIQGLALGGGAATANHRLDLLPLRALPVLTVDAAGTIHCRHVAVANFCQADLTKEVAA